jgi:hypothetical protein
VRARSTKPTGQEIEYRAGVHLSGTILWCDPEGGRSLCFLSRAGQRSPPRAQGVIASERTWSLLRASGGQDAPGTITPPMGRPFALGPLRLEMVPAGGLPGAAQLLVALEDGRRVLYAAAAAPFATRLAEPLEPRACDVVVLEARLPPSIVLPPRGEIFARLARFCEESVAVGAGVVLVADELGTAQELHAELGARGFCVGADRAVARWIARYRKVGVGLPEPEPPDSSGAKGADESGRIVIVSRRSPRDARRASMGRRVALVAADAGDPAALAAVGAIRGFELGGPPDLASLVRHAVDCHATRAFVVGPQADALAALLSARGIESRVVGPPRQLPLL